MLLTINIIESLIYLRLGLVKNLLIALEMVCLYLSMRENKNI